MPHPMRRPTKLSAPGSTPAITIILKSLRNPPLDISLIARPLTTSILELKQEVAGKISAQGTEKIRILYNKKPCVDSKTVKDVLGDELSMPNAIEFSVMVIGGVGSGDRPKEVPVVQSGETAGDTKMEDAPTVAQGASGLEVMESQEFWEDLKGYLFQRVRDEDIAEKASKLFQEVWKK
ncbi:hypothetical protein MMC19_001777 [Ptychographa xylographoides]|nr:hypothetical protein [Ptychographa xylographoides]